MLIVAYPQRCGDKEAVAPISIDLTAAEGASPRRDGELATGEALARLLPGMNLPAGSMGADYLLDRPRVSDTVRIAYPDATCSSVVLPFRYANGRALDTPPATLPQGHAADRPVRLQAAISTARSSTGIPAVPQRWRNRARRRARLDRRTRASQRGADADPGRASRQIPVNLRAVLRRPADARRHDRLASPPVASAFVLRRRSAAEGPGETPPSLTAPARERRRGIVMSCDPFSLVWRPRCAWPRAAIHRRSRRRARPTARWTCWRGRARRRRRRHPHRELHRLDHDSTKLDSKGLQFDSSVGRDPFQFILGTQSVIAGWDKGIVGMKVGGIRRLVIPPSLAYGDTRNHSIPPYSTLVFDVELIAVQ
jgi:hypothetical protein